MFVGGLLVMTSATVREVWTSRLNPVRRRLDNLIGCCAGKARLLLSQARIDLFAFEHKRDENSFAAPMLFRSRLSIWKARQSIPAVDQFFYGEQQEPILNDELRGLVRPLHRKPKPTGS